MSELLVKILMLPPLSSVHGKDVDLLIFWVHLLMAVLFIGWLSYFVITLVRFRSTRNPKASYTGVTSGASTWIEGAVVVAEALLLMFLAVPLWAKVADKFPSEKESTVVRVIAEQFTWSTRYPGGDGKFGKQDFRFVGPGNQFGEDKSDADTKDNFGANDKEVVVPVNKPVIIHLTSKDVIHSFKVNPFRVTQDAIPGLSIPIHFVPTQEGKFLINCAQLCGNGHAFMRGYVHVLSQEKFSAWAAEQAKKAAAGGGAPSFE